MDIIDSKYIGLVSSRLEKFKRVKADLFISDFKENTVHNIFEFSFEIFSLSMFLNRFQIVSKLSLVVPIIKFVPMKKCK